jgi:hypothetical protein
MLESQETVTDINKSEISLLTIQPTKAKNQYIPKDKVMERHVQNGKPS